MAIVPVQSISEFFHENVESAIKSLNIKATEGATKYLVDLLVDYSHLNEKIGNIFNQSYTLLYNEAQNESNPAERFDKMRLLGDGVLYGCGFFGEHFKARGLNTKYLQEIGTNAYNAISDMFRTHGADLFRELACKFDSFTRVLKDVSDATIAMNGKSSSGLVVAYERWLRTGGHRLEISLIENGINIRTSN